MPHVPIKIQFIMEYPLTKALSTKLTCTIPILMDYHAFLFDKSEKHEHLFMDVANTESAKFERQVKINLSYKHKYVGRTTIQHGITFYVRRTAWHNIL